jgi:hypothetical protein
MNAAFYTWSGVLAIFFLWPLLFFLSAYNARTYALYPIIAR